MTKMTNFRPEHFLWQVESKVARVRLDRPERKNPLTFQSYAELRDTFRELRYAEDVDAVLFLPNGGNFCSGGDVHDIIGPLVAMEMKELLAFTRMTGDLVKAMLACGKPIIASEVGGIPDMLGGDSGILVPPGDAGALSEVILRLARDDELRRTMGAAAKERYARLFSPNVVVPLMVETYRRVTRNGHGVPEAAAGNGQVHPWAHISY